MKTKIICKTAYCHFCKDFVDTDMVDLTIKILEISPSKRYASDKQTNFNYEEKTHHETKVKCLSCGGYDTVFNDIDFSKAVQKLVTESLTKK